MKMRMDQGVHQGSILGIELILDQGNNVKLIPD